ncbi:MAG: DUF4332 domain-containing protein [Ardenticatenales bacterium]
MRRALRLALFGSVLAVGLGRWASRPSPVMAQDCRPVLNDNVIVEAGSPRGCRLWVVGHHVAVARGASVDGGIVVAYGSADVDGDVVGAVNVINGDASINGHVTGDVYASGAVSVGAAGRVDGDVTGSTVRAAPGAVIEGSTTLLGAGWSGATRAEARTAVGFAVLLLSVLVTALLATLFGGLAAAFFPEAVAGLRAQAARGAGWTFVDGVLGLATIAVIGAVIVLLRGVPLVRVLAIVPLGLAAAGSLGIGQRFGARLLRRRGAPLQTGLGLAAIAVVISLITRSGPPVLFCLGGLLLLLFCSRAIGVALMALFVPRMDQVPSAPTDGRDDALPPVAAPSPPPVPPVPAAPAVPAAPDTPAGPVLLIAPAAPVPTTPPPSPASQEAPAAPMSTATSTPSVAPAPNAEPAAASGDSHNDGDDADADADMGAALDLRRIPGISPIYAHLLRAAGVHTLNELAERSPGEIVTALEAPSVLPIDPETAMLWIDMARRRLGR